MRARTALFLVTSAVALLAAPAQAGSITTMRKSVTLACPALGYRINCAISLRANPESNSHCFVATPFGSRRLKPDYHFGYYDDVVGLQVRDGLRVSGELTERATGRQASCLQIGMGGAS